MQHENNIIDTQTTDYICYLFTPTHIIPNNFIPQKSIPADNWHINNEIINDIADTELLPAIKR
jgi:hypothetical protein